MTNLGPKYGIAVAAALLVDYVLTVAVSISSAVENLGAVVPFVREHKVGVAIALVVLLTLINLRGVRESGLAFALPTYAFVAAIFAMLVWGGDPARPRRGAARRDRRLHGARRRHGAHRARPGVPAAARVLLRLRRAHRRGGDQQLRARVPQAQGAERGGHPGRARPARDAHVRRRHRARLRRRGQVRRPLPGQPPVRPVGPRGDRRPGDHPGGADRVRPLPVRRARGRGGHRADPRARGEHRVQRLPGARLGARPEPLPAPAAAHPRRPARVQQRHPAARRGRGRADLRLRRRGHPAGAALHRRRVRRVHRQPVRHGAALEPGARPGARPAGGRRACAAPGRSTPSAGSSPASC